MNETSATCALCTEEIHPDEIVVLDQVSPDHWVILAVGVQPGDMFEGEWIIFVHNTCLVEKGKPRGNMLPGRG